MKDTFTNLAFATLVLGVLPNGGVAMEINTARPEVFDVVVYGDTSGGVTAAVQAAKMGKNVALVSPTKHLGGLTSSGLGWTDLGNTAILGGLSREFYHRVYLHYQQQPNWAKVKTMAGQGTAAFDEAKQIGSIFEPKVAESIFKAMAAESGVKVFSGLLDLKNGVVMIAPRIKAVKMEDGQLFQGKMFIDASYEGDVLAGAGVSHDIGREANRVHGETVSGVRAPARKNQVIDGVSPYVVKNDPASGLLLGSSPASLRMAPAISVCRRFATGCASRKIPATASPCPPGRLQ